MLVNLIQQGLWRMDLGELHPKVSPGGRMLVNLIPKGLWRVVTGGFLVKSCAGASFDIFFKFSFVQSQFSGCRVVTGGFLVKRCAGAGFYVFF